MKRAFKKEAFSLLVVHLLVVVSVKLLPLSPPPLHFRSSPSLQLHTGPLPHLVSSPPSHGMPRLPPCCWSVLARGRLRRSSGCRRCFDPLAERRSVCFPVCIFSGGHGADVASSARGGLRRGGVGGQGREETWSGSGWRRRGYRIVAVVVVVVVVVVFAVCFV